MDLVNNQPDADVNWPKLDAPPKTDVKGFYKEFMDNHGHPAVGMDFFAHVRSWWEARHAPNVHLVHFNSLKSDLRGEIQKLAHFLGTSVEDDKFDAIVEHCSFDYMKAH